MKAGRESSYKRSRRHGTQPEHLKNQAVASDSAKPGTLSLGPKVDVIYTTLRRSSNRN